MNMMAVDITRHLTDMMGPVTISVLPELRTEWCMVLVRPGYEQNCRDSLRRRGVGAWWPNFSREIGHKDQKTGRRGIRRIVVPVLPGIVFCQARFTDAFWRALDLAPGAMNVARKFNTEVIVLQELDIVLIHKIEEGLNRSDPPKSDHSYSPGDVVRFVDDELRRFGSGTVIECYRDGRLKVDVNMLGRVTPWIVAAWQIEPVEQKRENQIGRRPTDARDRPAKSPSGRKAG